MFILEAERKKILSGEYPSRIIEGRQNKHIPGTKEFEQKRQSMKRINPNDEPAILDADAKTLVDRYKGTGNVYKYPGSDFPREDVITDFPIGKVWVISKQKYFETNAFIIIYSSTGVHVVPDNTYTLKRR